MLIWLCIAGIKGWPKAVEQLAGSQGLGQRALLAAGLCVRTCCFVLF
jgi:hypothetical protein